MEGVYGWVKSIIYYMIFLSVANNLLADSKYEKYVRFFAGMVLILLVVSPLTGGLRLDEQITALFQSITFQNDTEDIKVDLWGMEERRLSQMIDKYETAVENDVKAMAEAQGLTCVRAQVTIDSRRDSDRYGQVTDIWMELDREKGNPEEGTFIGSRAVNVDSRQIGSIQVEAVTLGEEERGDGAQRTGVPPDRAPMDRGEKAVRAEYGEKDSGLESEREGAGEAGDGSEDTGRPENREEHTGQMGAGKQVAGQAGAVGEVAGEPETGEGYAGEPVSGGQAKINDFTGKVADSYGLEGSHIKIWWKND